MTKRQPSVHMRWFDGIPKEDQAKFKQNLIHSNDILEQLKLIIENKRRESSNVTPTDYDSPSWAYKQAHENGYDHALREILSYLDIKL